VDDEHDPDGNVADFLEVYFYEDECYDIPNTASPDVAKRWLSSGRDTLSASPNLVRTTPAGGRNDGLPKFCDMDGDCYAVLNWENNTEFLDILALARAHAGSSELEPRGRVTKVCYAKGKSSSFSAKNYPGAANLATRGISFRSLANAASCVGSTVVSGTRLLYETYVAEHVMELQTPALWANSMSKGVLQSGADAPGKAEGYNWALMFADKTGYIFQTWKSLGVSAPNGLSGATPIETIMTALGSTTDIHNMLILDRSTNGLKAAVGLFPASLMEMMLRITGLGRIQKHHLGQAIHKRGEYTDPIHQQSRSSVVPTRMNIKTLT
jgi:chitinase